MIATRLLSMACFWIFLATAHADSGAVVGTLRASAPNVPGRVLHQGESVETSGEQTFTVILPDRSQLTIGPSSKVTFSRAEPNLDVGIVHVIATKRQPPKRIFKIRTRVAVLGVRGTQFLVEASDNGKTTLSTLEGSVAMASSDADLGRGTNTVVVNRGQSSFLDTSSKTPSPPQKFDPNELQSRMQKLSPLMGERVRMSLSRRANSAQSSRGAATGAPGGQNRNSMAGPNGLGGPPAKGPNPMGGPNGPGGPGGPGGAGGPQGFAAQSGGRGGPPGPPGAQNGQGSPGGPSGGQGGPGAGAGLPPPPGGNHGPAGPPPHPQSD